MVRKTTIPKKTTPRTSAPKMTPTAAGEATTPEAPVEPTKNMGKRELIDRVVETSGIKKKAAKPVVEAMLKELGDALSRGETLNLQPFGKAIVKNRKDLENAEIIELRLRRSKQAMRAADATTAGDDQGDDTPPSDPLVEAAE